MKPLRVILTLLLLSGSLTLGQSSSSGGPTSGAFISASPPGTGYQDVTEIAAPANPAAGVDRLYTNSSTHQLGCLTSSGGSCTPSASLPSASVTGLGLLANGVGSTYNPTMIGCVKVAAHFATPYNANPENEEYGLALHNAMIQAKATTLYGPQCVDGISGATPSGGFVGSASNNSLYANSNPWAGLSPSDAIDVYLPNGQIITSVQWSTPSSALNEWGFSRSSGGTVLTNCNTAGGCGPNNYPQFMPAGALASTSVTTNVATVTMSNAANCPFTTQQIVQPNNLATSTFLNGVNLTVLTPGCNGTASFTANFTHANYSLQTEASGSVTATCANGSSNCLPIARPTTMAMALPAFVTAGSIDTSTGNNTLTGTGTAFTTCPNTTNTNCLKGAWLFYNYTSGTYGSSALGGTVKVGHITGCTTATACTLEVNAAATVAHLTTGANGLWAIVPANAPVTVADGMLGNSANNNCFGHMWNGFAIDINGTLGGVGYVQDSCEELSDYINFNVSQQNQQVAIEASAGACAVWGDGVLTVRGHYQITGPMYCQANSGPANGGFTGGPGNQFTFGWILDSWSAPKNSYAAGPSEVKLGTVTGGAGTALLQDGAWFDVTATKLTSMHGEAIAHDCVNAGAGAGSTVNNNTIDSINCVNIAGANAVVELGATTTGNKVLMAQAGNSVAVIKDNAAVVTTPFTGIGTIAEYNQAGFSGGASYFSGIVGTATLTADATDVVTFNDPSASTGGTLTNGLANQGIVAINTATNSTAVPLEVAQGSITNTVATPALQVEATWNNAGLTGEAILLNVTNTNSAAASKLLDLRVGNTAQFTVDKGGNIVGLGSIALGSGPPSCGTGVTGAFCLGEASTAFTVASGMDACRADSTAHQFKCTLNNGAEFVSLMNFSTVTNALITSMSEDKLTGAAAAQTITESGATFAITRAGVETANLRAPWVFQNTNSTNNNTSIGLGVSTPGTSTGQTTLNVNGTTTQGNLIEAGTGGTWTAGVLSGQTKQFQVSPTGLTTLGTATCTTVGTAGGICPAEGTAPTNVAGAAPIYPDSTAHEYKAATNGSSSFGLMVRAQPSPINQTAQTAAITTATLCAAAAGACNVAGQYHVHFNFWGSGTACSNVTAGSVTFLLTWTDENAVSHAAVALQMMGQTGAATEAMGSTFPFQTALANESAGGDFTLSTNGTVIQYATGYTACTTGTGTYNLRATVTRIQ